MATNFIVTLSGKNYTEMRTISRFENKCPRCHVSIHLDSDDILGNNIVWNFSFELYFRCPKCNEGFITAYSSPTGGSQGEYRFDGSKPIVPKGQDIAKELVELSGQFAEIYKQADLAEKYGLSEIAGLGYRKALEFLIKDYLIESKKKEKAGIEKMFLGECIKLVGNERLQSAAKRAVWLGNDEAHYVRVYESKDISDLKELLQITMNYISIPLANENAEKRIFIRYIWCNSLKNIVKDFHGKTTHFKGKN